HVYLAFSRVREHVQRYHQVYIADTVERANHTTCGGSTAYGIGSGNGISARGQVAQVAACAAVAPSVGNQPKTTCCGSHGSTVIGIFTGFVRGSHCNYYTAGFANYQVGSGSGTAVSIGHGYGISARTNTGKVLVAGAVAPSVGVSTCTTRYGNVYATIRATV